MHDEIPKYNSILLLNYTPLNFIENVPYGTKYFFGKLNFRKHPR